MTVFDKHRIIDNSMPTKIKKYAIYLRKSRADRDLEGQSVEEVLERHKKILLDLAVRKGLYIEEIYEEVVSGETIKDRPEIQRLINDCYAGKYEGVLVVEITRLSRGNQADAQAIIDCFTYANNNRGVLVVTPTKTYDIAHNHDDAEYLEFELFMSRREYKMIKRRMDRGRMQAVVEGNYMGSYRPYGYNIVKNKREKLRTLTPNKEEAPIVKLMFEWTVNENLTPGKIAKRLDAMGVPTYTGEPEWSESTIKCILINPTYKGKVRWNDRMRIKTMKNGELITSRPRSNHTEQYMEFEGKHPAIVNDELFTKASSRYNVSKTKTAYKLRNPYAGLIVCKNCGKALRFNSYDHKKGNVAARLAHAPSKLCKVKSVIMDDLAKAVIHALKLYIEDFEMKVDNLPDVSENTLKTQIEALQRELLKTERKLSKLFDAWENDNISDNEFVERKAVNNEKIATIKKQIDELEDSIPEKEEYEEKIELFSEALDTLLDDNIDADIKNEFLKRIFTRIEFSRENGEEFILDIYLR